MKESHVNRSLLYFNTSKYIHCGDSRCRCCSLWSLFVYLPPHLLPHHSERRLTDSVYQVPNSIIWHFFVLFRSRRKYIGELEFAWRRPYIFRKGGGVSRGLPSCSNLSAFLSFIERKWSPVWHAPRVGLLKSLMLFQYGSINSSSTTVH